MEDRSGSKRRGPYGKKRKIIGDEEEPMEMSADENSLQTIDLEDVDVIYLPSTSESNMRYGKCKGRSVKKVKPTASTDQTESSCSIDPDGDEVDLFLMTPRVIL